MLRPNTKYYDVGSIQISLNSVVISNANIQIPKFRCEFWASIESGDAVCEISQPGMATRTTDPGYKW